MKVEALWEYPSVPGKTESLNHLLIRLSSPPDLGQKNRLPVVVILVLDRSWSMKGDKLKATLDAASSFVNWLTRYDYIGVVAYGSDVRVVQPVVRLGEKASIVNRIQTLTAEGSTNLSGGWLQGLKMAQEIQKEIGPCVRRVLLLTDGNANLGIVDPEQLRQIAENHKEMGISTTTIGFGTDFNEMVLKDIAQAGHGNFYFIESPEETSEVFFKEFGEVGSLYAQTTELKIKFPPQVRFLELLTDAPHHYQDQELQIEVGDMRSDDQRTFVMETAVHPEEENLELDIELNYYEVTQNMALRDTRTRITLPVGQESSPNPEVTSEIAIAWAGKTMMQAAKMAETDVTGALELLNNMVQRLYEAKTAQNAEVMSSLIMRLEEMQKRLREDSNLGRKFLVAGGFTLYQDKGDFLPFRDIEMHDRIHELSHKGDLDLYNSPELRQNVYNKMLEGYRYFIFDMSEVSYVDSSAVGALIQAASWVNRRGGLFVVANLTSTVEKLFQMTRLNTFIPVAESVNEAKQMIEARQRR
ncbi:MAG: anti-sigma factor antagonist [Leptospiraceae bacterium]|nr:anti-sigma factor antagonist [Leptospiraceae bacterium]MDW8307402.1 anti-sigma factor antagonist [Leptospiraceae bacterium]